MSKKKVLIIAAVVILVEVAGFYILLGSKQQEIIPEKKTEILYPEPAIHPEIIEKTFNESEAIDPIIDKQKHKAFYV